MVKKVEVLANIAVIIAAVVLCTVLAREHLFPVRTQGISAAKASPGSPFANASPKRTIQIGTKISLPGVDWGKSERTLLLALSTGCGYCTDSAPFYRKLHQQKPKNLQLVAVFPQSVEESGSYLNRLGISVGEIVQAPLSSMTVSGTPTLMLIDDQGVIKDSWVGKLSDGEIEKVLARIAATKGNTD